MIILLTVLVVISLTMLMVGYFLSPKPHAPSSPQSQMLVRRRASYADQIRRSSEIRPTRAVRFPLEAESAPVLRANFASSMSIASIMGRRRGEQLPWLQITLVLLLLFAGFSIVAMNTVFSHSALIYMPLWLDTTSQNTSTTQSNSSAQPIIGDASKAILRLGQLDSNEYLSLGDYNTWAYSACSAAAMTEVINAYGHHYHISDILNIESNIHEITPDQGLLEPVGIERTVAKFNFKTQWLNKPTLDDVIRYGNQGKPVIVDFPPARWAGGHILVVKGGNASSVFLVDSSRLNMQVMARSTFLNYWGGDMAAVVTPA